MIGEKIQQLVKDETREKQYKMYELCDLLTLSLPTLQRLFKRTSVETDILIKLCHLYNVKLNYFFDDDSLFESNTNSSIYTSEEPYKLTFLDSKKSKSEILLDEAKSKHSDLKPGNIINQLPEKRLQDYLIEIRSLEIEVFHLRQNLKDKIAIIEDKNTIITLLNQLNEKLSSGNPS